MARLPIRQYAYVNPVDLSVLTVQRMLPANPRRIAAGVVTTGAAAMQLAIGETPDQSARITLNDGELHWYHYEKYGAMVQLPFWLVGSAPGAGATVYEVLLT